MPAGAIHFRACVDLGEETTGVSAPHQVKRCKKGDVVHVGYCPDDQAVKIARSFCGCCRELARQDARVVAGNLELRLSSGRVVCTSTLLRPCIGITSRWHQNSGTRPVRPVHALYTTESNTSLAICTRRRRLMVCVTRMNLFQAKHDMLAQLQQHK